jgi:hypothetical protein
MTMFAQSESQTTGKETLLDCPLIVLIRGLDTNSGDTGMDQQASTAICAGKVMFC